MELATASSEKSAIRRISTLMRALIELGEEHKIFPITDLIK